MRPTNTASRAQCRTLCPAEIQSRRDFSENGKKQKRGYRPGDHVTGTVRANYFFGKPVDDAEITVKASAWMSRVFEAASAQGKTDAEGAYHFDLHLPDYFAGRPLSQGAARVLIEATVKDSAGHAETRGEPITVSESPLLITAVPEGGTLVPNLENQVFILTSYPDGTPGEDRRERPRAGMRDQHVTTDDGGVAVVRIKAGQRRAKRWRSRPPIRRETTRRAQFNLQPATAPTRFCCAPNAPSTAPAIAFELNVFSTEDARHRIRGHREGRADRAHARPGPCERPGGTDA